MALTRAVACAWYRVAMQTSLQVAVPALTSLAETGGTFNALPWIIGGIALLIIGAIVLFILGRRKKDDEAVDELDGDAPEHGLHQETPGDDGLVDDSWMDKR